MHAQGKAYKQTYTIQNGGGQWFSHTPFPLGSSRDSKELQTCFEHNYLGGCSSGQCENLVCLQIPHPEDRFHTRQWLFPLLVSAFTPLETLAPSCWEAISAEGMTANTQVEPGCEGGEQKKGEKRRKGPWGN